MGRLAVSVAGAVGGSLIGLSPGTGFLIGSVLGNILFPPDPIVTQGPRLGDLQVSSSTYGAPIALGFGTIRMPGNLIWRSALREVTTREETGGGKGFGEPEQVHETYSYFIDFAIAFGEGEADDVLRIWADQVLIYDKRSGATKAAGLKFRFHPGDEIQTADPTIEAKEGVGNVEAYRGIVYLVFDSYDITGVGHIPNITAEIAFKAAESNTFRGSDDITVAEGGLFDSINSSMFAVDTKRRRIYGVDLTGSPNGLRVYDLDTLNEVRQADELDVLTQQDTVGIAGPAFTVGDSGNIFTVTGATNGRPIVKIDPNSLAETGRFGVTSASVVNGTSGFGASQHLAEITVIDPLGGGRKHFLVQATQFDDLGLLKVSDMTYVFHDNDALGSDDVAAIIPGPPQVAQSFAWIIVHNGVNADVDIWRITVDSNASFVGGVTLGVDLELVDTITAAQGWNSDGSLTAEARPVRDSGDEGLIFVMDASSFTGSHVFKWMEDSGVVWQTTTATQQPSSAEALAQGSTVDDFLYGFADTLGNATLLDTIDGSKIVDGVDINGTVDTDFDPSGQIFYDGQSQSIIAITSTTQLLGQAFLGRASGLGQGLGDIVRVLSNKVGLDTNSDLDTTDIDSTTVRGYAIARFLNARQSIEPLSTAFFFDGVESDDKVVFVKRGASSVRTIVQADMIPLDEATFDVVERERIQEVELPEQISVTYLDIDIDYQQGNQSVKRVAQPDPTMASRDKQNVHLPIVFTASEAKQIVEQLTYSFWNERTSIKWRSSWEELDLVPADIVTLTLDNFTTEVRITEAVANLDLSVSFESVTETAVTFTSDVTADGGSGFPPQTILTNVLTQLFLFDIPLLRDIDSTAGLASRLYVGLTGYQTGWAGAFLYDSPDSLTFTNTGQREDAGVDFGVVTNKLPATTTPFQTDKTTQLNVVMQRGVLASVSEANFYNESNVALVGNLTTQNWEVILFQNAVQQVDGSYQIDTLLRARRGTDPKVDGHANGEFFIPITPTTMNSLLLSIGQLNVARFYKGVTFNDQPENADITSLASTFADLKPYAPAHLDAIASGNDIDFSWVRRTRLGGEWDSDLGDVPLGEDSEEYEVDVKDGPGGTVVRTISGLSTPSVTYTSAQQTTDGFTPPQSVITFEVFQISAVVNRGFGTEATITL